MTLAAAKGMVQLDGGGRAEKLRFRPSAVMLWWCQVAGAVAGRGSCGGIGVATVGGGEACMSWVATDDLPGALSSRAEDVAVLCRGDSTGRSDGLRGRVKWEDDGFALDCDGETGSSWQVHYLALGGPDLRHAAVRSLTLDASGVHAITGIGFRPDLVVVVGGASTDRLSDSSFSPHVGAASGAAHQVASGFAARAARGRVAVRGSQRPGVVVAVPEAVDAGGFAALASVLSFDADGFTFESHLSDGTALPVACLMLGGGSYSVGLTGTPRRRSRRCAGRLAFEPSGLLLFGTGLTATSQARDIGRLCVGGASTDRSSGCVSWSVRARRTALPLEPRARSTDEYAFEVLDTASEDMHARAVFSGRRRRSVSLDWPLLDGRRRELCYVAFGGAARGERPRTVLSRVFHRRTRPQ